MTLHLHNEIDRLKKNILVLCSMVEGAVRNAVTAVTSHDANRAAKVIENDVFIDKKEIELEEECLKILALYQPVASDLRYVAACLKVNNELERIGDLGSNIAKRARDISGYPESEMCVDFKPMMDVTRSMLKGALDSLIYQNEKIAQDVIQKDDIVDQYNRDMFEQLQGCIKENPELVSYYICLMNVSRHLERIADCATNICEDIIYMIRGEIVRHGGTILDIEAE
jgi:phosphate transport system protein